MLYYATIASGLAIIDCSNRCRITLATPLLLSPGSHHYYSGAPTATITIAVPLQPPLL